MSLKVYDVVWERGEEIEAETEAQALEIFRQRVREGAYVPLDTEITRLRLIYHGPGGLAGLERLRDEVCGPRR